MSHSFYNAISWPLAPHRTVLALFTHTALHMVDLRNPNIMTLTRGSGRGYRLSISLNFAQLRQLRLPLRFSHLCSSILTSLEWTP